MPLLRTNVIPNEWVACLGLLRDARALILRDAESFHEAATALERVGQIVTGTIGYGFSDYESGLLELGVETGQHDRGATARLLTVVREARNSAVHDGAWARHLSSRLIDLILILEEAIMGKLITVEDIMVRGPLVAETWHLVSHARTSMLANSFSHLPILLEQGWFLVGDAELMWFIRAASTSGDRKKRLARQLGDVIAAGEIHPVAARCCRPEVKVDELLAGKTEFPLLVTEDFGGRSRAQGILTPFDLL